MSQHYQHQQYPHGQAYPAAEPESPQYNYHQNQYSDHPAAGVAPSNNFNSTATYGGNVSQGSAVPALGYGDGAGYSTTGYRAYNDNYQGAGGSTSSPGKGRRFDPASYLYMPSTKWTALFAMTIILQLVVCLTLESIIFARFQQMLLPIAADRNVPDRGANARTITTYLSLLIFGFVYQVVLTYDALRTQNTIQIIGLVIMNLGILVYTSIQKDQIHEAYLALLSFAYIRKDYWVFASPILVAIPVLVAAFTVALAFLTRGLYMEFGWKIYKQIGADTKMKNRFLIYQIYIALLKFDFFLCIGFAIQFLVIVEGTSPAEKGITIAALPVFVLMLLLAAWSARHENIPTTIAAMVVYLVSFAYFVFKLVRMYNSDADRQAQYKPARRTLTVFAVITILLMIVTIAIASWCAFNYDKGLKPHILKRNRSTSVNSEGGYDGGKEGYAMDPYRAPGSGGSFGGGAGGPGRLGGGARMEID